MRDKIKLIYIVGADHSGSTLLDMILSTSPEVFGTGELFFFNDYMYKIVGPKVENFKCTYGSYFSKCSFWNKIKSKINNNLRILRTQDLISSLKITINLILPFRFFDINLGDDDKIIKKIASIAGVKKPNLSYLIDSSKDPRRLYQLVTNSKLDIKVIHLVRDGRAYIRSMKAPIREKSDSLDTLNPFFSILKWIFANLFSVLIIKKFDLDSIKLSYDLFCKNPKESIQEINEWLGITIPKNFTNKLTKQKEFHNINGNIRKFDSDKKIKYDQKWKKSLSSFTKIYSTLLLYPFNKLWVYSKEEFNHED